MLKIITEARAKNPDVLKDELKQLKKLGMSEACEMPFSAYDAEDTETIQLMFPNVFKAFISFIHEQTGIDKSDLDTMDEEWDTMLMPERKELWPCFIEYLELMASGANPQADKLYKKYYQNTQEEE